MYCLPNRGKNSKNFLKKTKVGLIVRAVGDSPESASNQGINVRLVRYLCILYGGAMSGLAGAYLSMIYTPQWIENMTGGRGWIALALVVFSTWNPIKILIGAMIFGGLLNYVPWQTPLSYTSPVVLGSPSSHAVPSAGGFAPSLSSAAKA